jgi:hypothetical protein
MKKSTRKTSIKPGSTGHVNEKTRLTVCNSSYALAGDIRLWLELEGWQEDEDEKVENDIYDEAGMATVYF